jgi:hypothetical protein
METLALVDIKTLPRIIAAPNGKILRRDLQWEDLTAQERSLQYIR